MAVEEIEPTASPQNLSTCCAAVRAQGVRDIQRFNVEAFADVTCYGYRGGAPIAVAIVERKIQDVL
jgi:precorrin isomerase